MCPHPHLDSTQENDRSDADQFAVSEQEFTERLNTEGSEESRKRLEAMTPAETQGGEGGPGLVQQLEAFTQRQPLSALLGALVAGLAIGLAVRKH
jgi:hypothetical protein